MVEFRPIPNLDGYYACNEGFVYREIPEGYRRLKGQINYGGYYYIMIKKKMYFVHRLVLLSFVDNPNNYEVVNHIDSNRSNNKIENLEWCTYKQNAILKNKSNQYSIKVKQYTKDNIFIAEYNSINEAARITNINSGNICNVCNKKPHYKYAGGFLWIFSDKKEIQIINDIDNKDIWRQLNEYPGYKICNDGRIYSLHLKRLIKPRLRGYYSTNLLDKNGKRKAIQIHRIVMMAFGPKFNSLKPFVNHIDGIKINNHISNLEYVSHIENIKHAIETGLTKRIRSVVQIDFNTGKEISKYKSLAEASRQTNISIDNICNNCKGKTIKTKQNFIFRYLDN